MRRACLPLSSFFGGVWGYKYRAPTERSGCASLMARVTYR